MEVSTRQSLFPKVFVLDRHLYGKAYSEQENFRLVTVGYTSSRVLCTSRAEHS